MLELPTNRAEYVGVLQDLGDYPARSPIGQRIPGESEVAALKRAGAPWCGVILLDDEGALKQAGCLFERVFVLDPFYDTGALLYAAWHDPFIKDEHSRMLAEQAGWLARMAPLLNAGLALLAPDHLPGSWTPRPGWRRPRAGADRRQEAGWSMRSGLVLLYWADRLGAAVCATRPDVVAALHVLLGGSADSSAFEAAVAETAADAVAARDDEQCEVWAEAAAASRRRGRGCAEDVAYALGRPAFEAGRRLMNWRVALGERSVPEPAPLLRRVLFGDDPEREPALPRRRLRRRPLCLLAD
ncbi:MAG: hypothetical protein JO157_18875 [Acetobacteraceae bacterium]|nr:hypothetical protein [Acetobacteraceae bacterium]